MANYSELLTAIWAIEKASAQLTGHAKAIAPQNTKFWQRMGSTRFAAEKQRLDLAITGQIKNPIEPKAETFTADRKSFEKLREMLLITATLADQAATGDKPTANARAKAISASMTKQATLLADYIDFFFTASTPTKEKAKGKKTA